VLGVLLTGIFIAQSTIAHAQSMTAGQQQSSSVVTHALDSTVTRTDVFALGTDNAIWHRGSTAGSGVWSN